MKSLIWLKRVLEASVARRGEIPLTNAHLLNIVKMAIHADEKQMEHAEKMLSEAMAEDKKWGNS